MNRPFSLFSWHEPFLPALLDYMCEHTNNMPGQSIIIIPNDRPKRYIIDLLRKHDSIKKPTLVPKMLTMQEVINIFCTQDSSILQTASLLDQVHLLYQAVKLTSLENDYMGQHFASMDLAHFMPWGTRLATLFEEYMFALQDVKNIQHAEGEVSAKAASLLSSLSAIHGNYINLLREKSWTTAGLNAQLAATSHNLPAIFNLQDADNKHIFIAGFLSTHKSEQSILKTLWQNNAHICIHSDPNINAKGQEQEVHWSCLDHIKWLKDWKTTANNYKNYSPTHHVTKSYLSGYDVHSQLLAVKELLNKQDTHSYNSTAIILTTPGLLMPMLHHLPEQEFNVSMGYPLNKSPLFSLLDAVARLHGTALIPTSARNITTQYYWRNLLHCLRHPYLQMLKTLPENDAPSKPIRHILNQMENALRQGSRYVQIDKLVSEHTQAYPAAEQGLIEDIIKALTDDFANVNTPKALAHSLMNLCQLLLNYGNDIWENSPLDGEAIYRLMQRVIPTLKGSAIADENLPLPTLFNLMQQLMQAERVPFEADPITGLQVLGLLETRLLHFERVIIVDATDDILPGFAAQDPLLPDALRHMLGLPDSNKRELNVAHTLHRLMAQAKQVHFFWQEGVGQSNLFDGKKSRSRFIDSALWKEEQELGYIINNGDAPLNIAPCVISPILRKNQNIVVTEKIKQKMHSILQYGISPTRLDTYIKCPQRFAWENIYKIKPLEEVSEEYNPLVVGNLLHDILHQLYLPFTGKIIRFGDIDESLIDEHFNKFFKAAHLEESLAADSLIMLRLAVPIRLKRFLQNQPELTQIIALEKDLNASIALDSGQNYKLIGKVDRIDKRHVQGESQLIILDYKTGKLPQIKFDVWDDDSFWHEITSWNNSENNGLDILKCISESFNSIQLPCYMHLCQENYSATLFDAGFVNLAEDGKENFLLGDDPNTIWREHVLKVQIPNLLHFVLKHMSTTQSLPPSEGEHCTYCPYGNLCSR